MAQKCENNVTFIQVFVKLNYLRMPNLYGISLVIN
jgi:hypothetical protein